MASEDLSKQVTEAQTEAALKKKMLLEALYFCRESSSQQILG